MGDVSEDDDALRGRHSVKCSVMRTVLGPIVG